MQSATIQKNAIWNLDMLTSPYDDSTYKYKYNGKGVRVYVIDTGLDYTNKEFGGRAKCGWDPYNTSCIDLAGHGTVVSGIVGSKTCGVAKKVTLIGVKVFDNNGLGTTASAIAGLDYVIGQKRASPNVPMVINMSLGSGKNSMEIRAVLSACHIL
jgi:subtilisin family serine protease